MRDLDNPELLKQLDQGNMLACLHEMPDSCQRAWQMALDFTLPPDYAQVNKVVVAGMGGSAIGSDLVRSLTIAEARLPVLVLRDYDLPGYVDGQTLVIASSYSGLTEETLSFFTEALRSPASMLVLTTGGKLKEMAEQNKVPVFQIDYQAQPRAALAFSCLPVLAFFQRLAFIGDKSASVAETVAVLRQLSTRIKEDIPISRNPAKQLAEKLHRHLSVIYGAGILAEVAHRWKTQLNENSKTWAFYDVLPELNHNSVVGYQFPPELAKQAVVVMLRSAGLHERIKLRYEVTAELLDRAKVHYEIVDAEGTSPLSQMMSLVLFGDYVSYYLAILCKVDPSTVAIIDYLKKKLAEG